MNKQTSIKAVGGLTSFVCFLTLLFVTMKVFNVITWSWWWVFAPLWIHFGVGILFAIIFAIIFYFFG